MSVFLLDALGETDDDLAFREIGGDIQIHFPAVLRGDDDEQDFRRNDGFGKIAVKGHGRRESAAGKEDLVFPGFDQAFVDFVFADQSLVRTPHFPRWKAKADPQLPPPMTLAFMIFFLRFFVLDVSKANRCSLCAEQAPES